MFLFEKQAIFAQICKMKIKKILAISIICLFAIILIQSCATTKRNLVYFSNLPDSIAYKVNINNELKPRLGPGDALAIKVTTLNPDANILFNSGSLPMNNQSTGISSGVSSTAVLPDGYVVDNNGEIDFPVLGKVKLEGLTLEEAQNLIAQKVAQSAKKPIVNIRILNFKVTVIGEVARPGSFTISNNRINVLEALGLAGDMTPYAVRENVLVIHEKEGVRSMERLDLTDKKVFNSPFFYLQQNDIVYVQPENKLKVKQANPGRFQIWSLVISSLSTLALSIYYISHSNN